MKDYYTGLFTNKFETEKYYIQENNRLYSNGDIVIGNKPEATTCEIRHSFTVHSIQGETAEHNLFIDCSRMFDSRMFYTALSRARRLDQIYIVQPPEQEFKYNGKIYKIVCNKKCYIGSTVSSLEKRFNEHKQGYKKYIETKKDYVTSYEILQMTGKVKIELIETFKCNSIQDLQKREAEVIKEFGNKCVNKTFNEKK